MIVPLATLAALVVGAAVCALVARRPVPLPVFAPDLPPVQRTIWSSSARELYRTVVGVVDDLDVGALRSPIEPDRGVDPAAVRVGLTAAVTRARGTAAWALALRDRAPGRDADRACDQLAGGLAALADAASAAFADPGDADRARRVHAVRERVRDEAERLVRLL